MPPIRAQCSRDCLRREITIDRREIVFPILNYATMNETPHPTAPPFRQDQLLRDKLIEDITGQSTRMDDLARQLIALELAVPGIYAAALKLVPKGTVFGDVWLRLTFVCWGMALVLALIALTPRNYRVDRNRLSADEENGKGPLSIEGYFRRSALHKRRLLLPSCGLFFAGICCAVATLL